MIQLRIAVLSDIGRVRQNNEDRYVRDEKLGLYGVADGVGGQPGGAEAAELALASLVKSLQTGTEKYPDLAQLVRVANQAVYKLGETISPRTGIGSTLTVGHIRGDLLVVAHVGDSRCYFMRNGQLHPLTTDHSVENEILARRARGETVYFHEGNRNALTRCIGQPPPLEVDIVTRNLLTGDRVLFCTDGITRLVSDEEIAEFLARPTAPETLLREIVTLAIRRGGPDNATGVLLQVEGA
ncbi:MAG: PP2C family protein-serine/threonine phosphatase [Opitutales bacterium]